MTFGGGYKPGLIELRLRSVDQLFNSLDPSPFIERDLAHEAEEFITSWAREHSRDAQLRLVIHLGVAPEATGHPRAEVVQAIRNYFEYHERLKRLELRELFRRGRSSLAIGLAFLTACLLVGRTIAPHDASPLLGVLRESLLIGGWVAMWRPLEIHLYDWWPMLRAAHIDARLAAATIEIDAP